MSSGPTEESDVASDCDAGSLRALGFQQGCIVQVELPIETVELGTGGTANARRDVHPRWVIVEQDCSLAWGDAAALNDVGIEIRPVLTTSPPEDQGVRSSKFRLGQGEYIDDGSPRQSITPALLATFAENHIHESCLSDESALALKTWLGLRYDRPAVPQTFVPTYGELSKRIRRRKHPLREHLRDVLVQFSEAEDGGVLFDLVAMLPSDHSMGSDDREALADWLAEVCLDFPTNLGTATGMVVLSSTEISLDFIERSYALDLSYITWPAKGGGPVGAA